MNDKLKNQIKDFHTEEMKDCQKYHDLIVELKADGCHRAAGIIADIAADEETHAMALSHIMEHNE